MRNTRSSSWLAAAALMAGVVGGCADERAVAGPQAAARVAVAPAPLSAKKQHKWTANGLLRDEALPADITVRQVIGRDGGTLVVPTAGLTLVVPANAVDSATTFVVTALAGSAVAYDFGPDGARFPTALVATQDLKGTNAKRLPRSAVLSIGYFGSAEDLDVVSGLASVTHELTATLHPSGKSVSFEIPHFSGWLIHWRADGTSDSTQIATP